MLDVVEASIYKKQNTTMAKTSRKAGKAASQVLRKSTSKVAKTAAGSALRQRRDRR